MTEDEARTKWCPFTRTVYIDDQPRPALIVSEGRQVVTAGDGSLAGVEQHCIADACMAWRWSIRPVPLWKEPAEGDRPAVPGEGYCGLAGHVP